MSASKLLMSVKYKIDYILGRPVVDVLVTIPIKKNITFCPFLLVFLSINKKKMQCK